MCVQLEPVVSKKSGHIFEKRTIRKYIQDSGHCPVTGNDLALSDLVDVKANSTVKPKAAETSSLTGIISMFQNEWDAHVLEMHLLRKELDSTRTELSHTLYQHDAACRVIAKLLKDQEALKAELAEAKKRPAHAPPAAAAASAAMDVDSGPGISDAIKAKMDAKSGELSKGRKKREVSAGLAKEEAVKGYASKVIPAHGAKDSSMCLDVHPNKPLVVSGSKSGTLEILNTDQAKSVCKPGSGKNAGHTKAVNRVLFHASQDIVVSASENVRLWNSATGAPIKILTAHTCEVTGITLHATGDYLVAAAVDRTWAFYDLETGTACQIVSDGGGAIGAYSGAQFHPDGLILGTCSADSMVKLWDVKSQQNIVTLPAHGGAKISSLNFSENGYYLATSASDGIKVWDLRKVSKQGANAVAAKHYEGASARDARFDFSGQYLVGAFGNLVRVWQAKTWNDVAVYDSAPADTADIVSVAWGHDAKFLVSASLDGSLKLWA
jgi:pre-mRNA-processing factor 19